MNKRIITINRMYGSNGRIIGKALANEMGIGFYDREQMCIRDSQKVPSGFLYNWVWNFTR